ncbi:MAG TPA: amidohydrolase family protein [Candidatus Limiplasma stercoravium]|nr:amidohydrolase family protein [Candidatus Limiplasma stercoravium]
MCKVFKGRVIDGQGGAPIERGAVAVEGNQIAFVGAQEALPPRFAHAQVFEVENGSILPGLIEAHVHLSWGGANSIHWINYTPQLEMARALRDMGYLRQQGYTAVRDMGSGCVFLKAAVAEGLLDVPRIFAAGRILTQIGGHGDAYQKLTLEASERVYGPAFIVNGVDEVRRACRINARNGADFIKIMTTGGVFSQGDKAGETCHFSRDEIRAAVEEADNMGSYVSSHAQANKGIRTALENGVRCIEHGFYLDEYCVELMVKNGCYLVPTLSIMHTSKVYNETHPDVLPELREKTLRSYEAHYRSLDLAHRAGVKIGMGCDFVNDATMGSTYDHASMEFERMKAAGFSAMEIIQAATRTNAELLMMQDRVGTLEQGKLADLILVEGNPLDDITLLCDAGHVKTVLQDGRVVKDIRGARG